MGKMTKSILSMFNFPTAIWMLLKLIVKHKFSHSMQLETFETDEI